MANTPVEVKFHPTGLTTLFMKLFPIGSDVLANATSAAVAMTENTNKKNHYSVNVSEALSGTYDAVFFIGAVPAGVAGVVRLRDTTDRCFVEDGVSAYGKTPIELMCFAASGALGEISGAGTGTELVYAPDGTSVIATVTATSVGNRTNVVYA